MDFPPFPCYLAHAGFGDRYEYQATVETGSDGFSIESEKHSRY